MFQPSSIIAPPGGWTPHKPPCGAPIDRSHPLGRPMIAAFLFSERSGRRANDGIVGIAATATDAVTWTFDRTGVAWRFNGGWDYATIPLNLSPFRVISIEFWLWWDAYALSDNIMLEYGPNANNQNAFYISPNCNNGRFRVMLTAAGGYYISTTADFVRPSALAWHHYVIVLDRVTKTVTPYVDGVPVSYVPSTNGAFPNNSNFGTFTAYLMGRGGTGLFSAGMLSLLRFYAGALTASDARTLYEQPYCMYHAGIPPWRPHAAARPLIDGSLATASQLIGATA